MARLFDPAARIARRDRAARRGPELFLAERAFADILDNVAMLSPKPRQALLLGTPDRSFERRLGALVGTVEAVEPAPALADHAGSRASGEGDLDLAPASLDLVVSLGTLDTVDDLPAVLRRIASALRPDGMMIGVMPGGETLPLLRRAMRAADAVAGIAAAHVHPRIEPQALTGLLAAAGLINPVVEVDRVTVRYSSLWALVGDLRAMGATNVLSARPRTPLSRPATIAACESFAAAGSSGRTTETFELLHFAAWRGA